MKSISILGSGWLGLPLAEHFVKQGLQVKASTTSAHRQTEISAVNAQPFIVDIENLADDIQAFLQSEALIINITSKNIDAFGQLAREIELSPVDRVLFVGSTSVYSEVCGVVSEADNAESVDSPLLKIEQLLTRNSGFSTTLVRFAGLVGPGRHPGRFFSSGRAVPNPEARVNLIHLDDCIGIINRIIEQQCWDEVFNCCADTHPSRREFYSLAARSLGDPIPEFNKSGSKSDKIISNLKVKKQLDYKFKHADLMRMLEAHTC